MRERPNYAKKIGRMRYLYFTDGSNYIIHKPTYKGATWFIDFWRFRIWRDGCP